MPAPKDVVVRVQALDGAWETLGADRARGVVPENVQLVSDQWGSKTASFDLRRDPKAFWPDIGAFAPVEVEVGGRLVWSGRVSETPVRDSTDSVISVQCEGWQAHLDDDLYERIYAHTNLADWKDARGDPSATLTTLLAVWQVSAESGKLSLICPTGSSPNGRAALVLDLGPNSTASRVVVDWSITARAAASGNRAFYLGSSNMSGDAGGSPTYDLISASSTATSGTYAKTLTTASRWLFLIYDANTYASACTADDGVTITSVQVFADTAYESSNASVLKADQVVKDALSRATLLLSSDTSAVEAGTFSIPELAPSEPRTPREMWNAVDAFEDRFKKIDVLKRPIYKAKPSTPEVEVGAWSGMEFEDSSSNAGEDTYSSVVITGSKADGSTLRVSRSQGQQTGVTPVQIDALRLKNPSFASDTSNWTTTNSVITRDTSTFDTSPASGRWDESGTSNNLSMGLNFLTGVAEGTFAKGLTYTVICRVKANSVGAGQFLELQIGSTIDNDFDGTVELITSSGWTTIKASWTPSSTFVSGINPAQEVSVRFSYSPFSIATSTYFHIDTVSISVAKPTVVERRGFSRSKQLATSFTLTDTAAQQIADKWLLSHKTSPFKGRAKLTGNQAVRDLKTGRNIPAEELLLRTGELVRFGDRIDPDTGAAGRDGRLVEAQYNADTDSVDLTIDSSRAGFEALLERLGVVLGQNRFG